MSRASLWAIVLGSLSAFACASSGVSYSGDSRPRLAEPFRVVAVERAPEGLERLGRLKASCAGLDVGERLHGERMSDVGCSFELLLAALRDQAALAGGTALVGLVCEGGEDPASNAACDAEVWAAGSAPPADEAREPAAVPIDARGIPAPLAPGYGSVAEAWDVRIDYESAPGQAPRAPIGAERVAEIDFPRVGYVRLGDARARGDERCSLDALRTGLRAIAARIGATSVVGVRCVEGDGERMCVASLAALGVEADAAVAGAR